MVKIEKFEVDHWILTRSTAVEHNLAHSYCLPRSIDGIQDEFNSNTDVDILSPVLSKSLDYGPMKGSEDLRSKISHFYSSESFGQLAIENIVTTPGASLANFLVLFSLLGPGDHAIVQYPTYQQLYSLPKSFGADLSFWKSKEDDDWRLDLPDLKSLIRPNTKMIIISNPQNPTGAIIGKQKLEEIVQIARSHSIIIFSDEVYRPLFHSISPTDPEYPPSILSMGYENVIATSSLSKAYSVAGLRIGWIASHNHEIIDLCVNARSYALITASQIDEHFASFILSPLYADRLIDKNRSLAKRNVDIVQTFIDKNSTICEWVKPTGAPIGFIKFTRSAQPVDDLDFCNKLLEKKGVLLVPGEKCFGDGVNFPGYVRLGFGGDTRQLEAGLEAMQGFLESDYRDVPLYTQQ